MFNSIVENILIGIVMGSILVGTFVSVRAKNRLDEIQKMYLEEPGTEETRNIA